MASTLRPRRRSVRLERRVAARHPRLDAGPRPPSTLDPLRQPERPRGPSGAPVRPISSRATSSQSTRSGRQQRPEHCWTSRRSPATPNSGLDRPGQATGLTHRIRCIAGSLQLRPRAVPGPRGIRRVLAGLDEDSAMIESDLESLLLTASSQPGCPHPVPQHLSGRRLPTTGSTSPTRRSASRSRATGSSSTPTGSASRRSAAPERPGPRRAGWCCGSRGARSCTNLTRSWRQIDRALTADDRLRPPSHQSGRPEATEPATPLAPGAAQPTRGRRQSVRRATRERRARPRWEMACFSSADIWANVLPSPSAGTKTGS